MMKRSSFLLLFLLAVPGVAAAQWDSPTRAFHKNTAFPLEGRHMAVPCESCHLNGVTKGTPTTCYGCHWVRRQDDLYRTRLGSACEQCHRPTSWKATTWNHGTATGLTLNLAHKMLDCGSCHKNASFVSPRLDCVGCHRKDYDATKNPSHASAGFAPTCQDCHFASDAAWTQGRFNHATVFQLVGVHATVACTTCHTGGRFTATSTTCVGCHLTNYNATKNPSHAAAGFPTSCQDCHKATDANWTQGAFNHATKYPLVGIHATVACTTCHTGGNYATAPTTCVGCHLGVYNSSKNPNHAAAGFPTTCETCHKATDATWLQGVFSHTWFPIASGRHSGNPCSACHTNTSNYAVFTCLTCHGSTETNSHHKGVSGYRYDSPACYACHPQGRAGDLPAHAAALHLLRPVRSH